MKGVVFMDMAKVTSKGQITIPVSIRRKLNINEGDKLLFIDRPDGVMMVNPDMLPAGQDADLTAAEPKEAPGGASASGKPEALARPVAAPRPQTSAMPAAPVNAPAAARASSPETSPAGAPLNKGGVDIAALLDEIRSIGSKI